MFVLTLKCRHKTDLQNTSTQKQVFAYKVNNTLPFVISFQYHLRIYIESLINNQTILAAPHQNRYFSSFFLKRLMHSLEAIL